MVADKAYGSRANVDLTARLGAEPIIPLRVRAKLDSAHAKASPARRKLYHLYQYRQDEFLAHYHGRSNAESTFSAVKRVFGDTLRSKTFAAQRNELLLKVIAHNIVCVVHSIFDLGVSVSSLSGCTQTAAAAYNGAA